MTAGAYRNYTLRVRLVVEDDGLAEVASSLNAINKLALRARASVFTLSKGWATLGQAAAATTAQMAGGLAAATAQAGAFNAQTRQMQTGLRGARREAVQFDAHIKARDRRDAWLGDTIRRANAGGGNYGRINTRITGGRRSAYPSAQSRSGGDAGGGVGYDGNLIAFLPGGWGASVGGAVGGMAGGPLGSLVGAGVGASASLATGGAGSLLSGIASIGSEADNATAGIAGLLVSIDRLDSRQARTKAGALRRGLYADAAATGANPAEYVEAFGSIYTPLRERGADHDKIREFTRLSLAAGRVVRPNQSPIFSAFDIAQALSGNVSDRATPIASTALRAGGVNIDSFRKANPTQQMDMLLKGFQAFAPAIKEVNGTLTAQSSMLKSRLLASATDATRPAYDGMIRAVTEVSSIFEKANPTLSEFWSNVSIASEQIGGMSVAAANFAARFGVGLASSSPAWMDAGARAGLAADTMNRLNLSPEGAGKAVGTLGAGALTGAALYGGTTMALLRSKLYIAGQMGEGILPGYGIGNIGLTPEDAQSRIAALWGPISPASTLAAAAAEDTSKTDPAAAAIKALTEALGKPLKVEVRTDIRWGSDRSAALAFEDVVAQITERSNNLPRTTSYDAMLGL